MNVILWGVQSTTTRPTAPTDGRLAFHRRRVQAMTEPSFKTSAQVAREKAVAAESSVERLKRALESCIASEGFRPRDRVGQYCERVGIGVRISKGAGVEFHAADALEIAHAIDQTPMPDTLRRYYE